MIARIMVPALLLLTAVTAGAQSGSRDRYFARYPFAQWKGEGSRSGIKWSARVFPAHLSVHQRLITRIEIAIEAHEIGKRRGRGELIAFIEITDASGRHWRTHNVFNLRRIPEDTKATSVLYQQDAFVLPGDYRFSLAICDSQTQEHSFASRTLHVAALRDDPLPEAWRDLPPLEFVRLLDTPDVWFQPYVRGRLRLPVETRLPIHIDLLMNMTPSERVSGSLRVFRRNMSTLIPALKVLSGIDLLHGSLDVTLLDLTRRHAWEQKNVRGLDWRKMREPFAEGNPGTIDVQSLAAKNEMRQFFHDQVMQRVETKADGSLRVVIILSAPAFLEHQDKIGLGYFPKDANRRVFYMKYRPLPPLRPIFDPFNDVPRPAVNALPSDDLERSLRFLDARVLSSISPQEFRKAVSAMLAEISRM